MYRRTRKYQDQVDRIARARAAKERKRFEECGHHPDKYPPELPALRKVIEITDFDSGIPVTHRLELYRTSRIDCYSVWIDGQLWKERIGWSRILEGLRKALPRLRQDA